MRIIIRGWRWIFFIALSFQLSADEAATTTFKPKEDKVPAKEKSKLIPPRGDIGLELNRTNQSDTGLPSTGDVLSIVGVLLFAILLAVYLKVRRRGRFIKKGKNNHLELVSTLSIPGAQIHLLQAFNKIYLIGLHDKHIVCLDTISDPNEIHHLVNTSQTSKKQASFHDEYTQMIEQMSQGKQKAQPSHDLSEKKLSEELDQLKKRLKEIV